MPISPAVKRIRFKTLAPPSFKIDPTHSSAIGTGFACWKISGSFFPREAEKQPSTTMPCHPKQRSHVASGIHGSIQGSIQGSVTLRHGPSVVVEEDEDTYALAIGDTRALRNLKAFTRSAPDRHAALFILNKKTAALRVITDRINFSKDLPFHRARRRLRAGDASHPPRAA